MKRLRDLLDRLPRARFAVKQAMSAAAKCTAPISGMGSGGGGVGDPTGEGALRVDMAKTTLREIEREIDELRAQLLPLFDRLSNPFQRQLLTMRYIDGHSARDIAYIVAYSESHVFWLLRAAEKSVCNM